MCKLKRKKRLLLTQIHDALRLQQDRRDSSLVMSSQAAKIKKKQKQKKQGKLFVIGWLDSLMQ